MTEQASTSRSDEAETRGEHDYTEQRDEATAPTGERILRQRREGQYAAGADGTQSVAGNPGPSGEDNDEAAAK